MSKLARWQPPPTPGWNQYTERPRQSTANVLAVTALREILIFGALSVAVTRSGWFTGPPILLAVLLARSLLGILWKCRTIGGWGEIGRALAAGIAIAGLAVIALGPPTPKTVAHPKPKAVKVDAAQADQLEVITKQARRIWADAYAQTLGRGASKPLEETKPKGSRR